MISRRSASWLVLAAALALVAPGCGGKKTGRTHAAEETPVPAVPTPDNTPIDVLRTPAGLVLKTEDSSAPAKETTPPPAAAPKATP
jgi:hypothetical protein